MICSVISINLIKQTKLWEILTQTWDFSWMEMVMLKSIIQKIFGGKQFMQRPSFVNRKVLFM